MRTLLYISTLLVLLVSCKSMDTALSTAEANKTKSLVETADFEIVMNWAIPMGSNELNQLNELLPLDSRTGRINLVGTTNYIRKQGDSLQIYLPYYGTRQMNANPTDINGAIEFEGIPENYKVTYKEGKAQSLISFKFKENQEVYNMYITIEANQRVYVSVNSTYRTSIRYTGAVRALEAMN